MSGSAAKIELSPSESPTGSNTCLYMPRSSRRGSPRRARTPSGRCTTLRPTCGPRSSSPASTTRCSPARAGRSSSCSSGSGSRSTSPRSRPAAGRCTATRATPTTATRWPSASSACSPTTSTSSRRRRRASAFLREHCAAERTVFELTEFLVDELGVEDVGASFPHRVAYHPTCHSLRLLKVGDRPLRLLRAVQGIDLVEIEDAQECCGFGGTFAVKNADTSMAMLSDKLRHVLDTRAEVCTSADNSCLMHIGGALRRSAPACARCTSPRSWRRRNEGLSRPPPARRCATPSCAATSARRRRRSAPSGSRRSPSSTTGRRCATAGSAIKARDDGDAARAARAARGVGHGARAGSCTGRATAPRRTRSWPGIAHDHGAREVIKVKSLATDEIELNEALAARGDRGDRDRPRGADHPARAATLSRTSSCRRSTRTAPRSGALFERTIAKGQDLGWEATAIAEAARRHLREKFLSVPVAVSGRELRDRRDRARSASSSPRATGACARRCPRCS